jgi:methionyl-tRNA formyltransferase
LTKKVLILGYDSFESPLHSKLEELGYDVLSAKKTPSVKPNQVDLTISYGLKHLLAKDQIDSFRPINLHISFLPFNRGYHPNFWSFMENSPSGVTIHRIDEGIDTGPVLAQRQVDIDPKMHTFASSYELLRVEIETLLLNKIEGLFDSEDSKEVPQLGKGSFHRKSDLPKEFRGWNSNIYEERSRLRELYSFPDYGFS